MPYSASSQINHNLYNAWLDTQIPSLSPTTEELVFFFSEDSPYRRIVSVLVQSIPDRRGEVLSVHVKIQVYHVQQGQINLTGISHSP